MNKIIKIEPSQKLFSITWMLGSFCNYDCMYCPTDLHDNTSSPHDLETMKKTWQTIYEKTAKLNLYYKISFSGGEVTANKNFLPLLEWLRKDFDCIDQIALTTNGSASLNYYKKLADLVTSISFSTHSEFINEKKFFSNSKMLSEKMVRPKKSFHVNIMNESWAQDRIKLYTDFLEKNNISHSLNEIDLSFKTRNNFLTKGIYNLHEITQS